MATLYDQLKPYHIQQDSPSGCSLASFLMIRNCILNQKKTQSEFREYLKTKSAQWLKMVTPGGSGVSSSKLHRFIFGELGRLRSDNKYQCQKIKSRGLTLDEFKSLLFKVSNGDQGFLIFNYDAHYSPFAGIYALNIKILDVDFSGVYDREFSYGVGIGERNFHVNTFFKKLSGQNRSIMYIKQVI